MLRHPVTRLRWVSVAEATSFVLLLVATALKYAGPEEEVGVQVLGPVHGALFVVYVVLALGGERTAGDWRPRVLRTVASREEGLDGLVAALAEHRSWLEGSGELARRRLRRAAEEVEAIALTELRVRMGDLRAGTRLHDLAARVVAAELDPYAAAGALVTGLTA